MAADTSSTTTTNMTDNASRKLVDRGISIRPLDVRIL